VPAVSAARFAAASAASRRGEGDRLAGRHACGETIERLGLVSGEEEGAVRPEQAVEGAERGAGIARLLAEARDLTAPQLGEREHRISGEEEARAVFGAGEQDEVAW
jgi:hypothetical protein